MFLCEADKTTICQLDATEMKASLRFNTYSELSFTVGRTYLDLMSGQTKVHPFYDKIEALRLVYLEGFGYFELQDGKKITAGRGDVLYIPAYTSYKVEYSSCKSIVIHTVH